MCGIAGLWAPDLAPAERLALVEGMLGVMRQRGPDGTAVWQGDGLTLGITRLAIVAPDEPTRVYCSEGADLHTVVNGEIYNHLELRTLLAARGHRLEPGPDTVVVPHLYEEHGLDFPAHLDGMFAVALWDAKTRRLILARDRAGEKPLFYTHTAAGGLAGRFAFASEPGALAGLPWVSHAPAPGALARYLAHGFFAGDDCAFAALRQLPPAHVLEVAPDGMRLQRYWRPWDGVHPAPRMGDDVLADATRETLAEAVESRMPGDVPFGVFLSGGVDSGLVATLAARRGHRFPVFSMKLAGQGYDETGFARQVAGQIGAEYYEAAMDHADGEEAIELLRREDGPAARRPERAADLGARPARLEARAGGAHRRGRRRVVRGLPDLSRPSPGRLLPPRAGRGRERGARAGAPAAPEAHARQHRAPGRTLPRGPCHGPARAAPRLVRHRDPGSGARTARRPRCAARSAPARSAATCATSPRARPRPGCRAGRSSRGSWSGSCWTSTSTWAAGC